MKGATLTDMAGATLSGEHVVAGAALSPGGAQISQGPQIDGKIEIYR